jgi:flagellar basal body-associated protein FliL
MIWSLALIILMVLVVISTIAMCIQSSRISREEEAEPLTDDEIAERLHSAMARELAASSFVGAAE